MANKIKMGPKIYFDRKSIYIKNSIVNWGKYPSPEDPEKTKIW